MITAEANKITIGTDFGQGTVIAYDGHGLGWISTPQGRETICARNLSVALGIESPVMAQAVVDRLKELRRILHELEGLLPAKAYALECQPGDWHGKHVLGLDEI